MFTFTYRYKIKPTKHQARQFEQYLDTCRSVYNYAHAERKAWLNSRKSRVDCCSIISEYIIPADASFPSYNWQAKALTQAKLKLPHLKLVNAQCLQQVLRRLDRAWSDFFDKPNRGFPRFRSKNRFRSFVFPQLGKNCLTFAKVKLPSIGWIRIRQSRPYPVGFIPKQFQVVKKASGYFVMIAFESQEAVPDTLPGSNSIGIDAGIESFIATPEKLIKSPKFLIHKARKLKLLQRRLKKKIKGSNNWLKLQQRVAILHEKVANARRDWLFKLAHTLCDQADNIFVEDINFKAWSKGLFCKQSLDSGIGGFLNQILPFVSWKRGKFFLKVNKDFSSQECPKCHQRTGKKGLNQRTHHCQFCGHSEPRDTASAKIIQHRGEIAMKCGLGGFPHEQLHQDAVGHTVNQNACGDDAVGFKQLCLFELAGNLRTKNLPLNS